METTLELRWFIKGIPPAVVQRWFILECPGKFLEEKPETREDLYAYRRAKDVDKFKAIALPHSILAKPHLLNSKAINLKLREGKLELKLRQSELTTQLFKNGKNSVIWEGNIEQWCKLTEQELKNSGLFSNDLIPKADWISVYKKRQQKVEQGVESELTWLRFNNSDRANAQQMDRWWSIAFEMTMDQSYQQTIPIAIVAGYLS